jgi:hypothetical protein
VYTRIFSSFIIRKVGQGCHKHILNWIFLKIETHVEGSGHLNAGSLYIQVTTVFQSNRPTNNLTIYFFNILFIRLPVFSGHLLIFSVCRQETDHGTDCRKNKCWFW